MEGIVVGIAQINFHKNLNVIKGENSSLNFAKYPSTIMSDCENLTSEEPRNVSHQDTDISTVNNSSETESISDSGWEEIEDNLEDRQNKKGYTFAERRQMPSRSSKESSLLGIKRRSITKPTKRIKAHEDFQNLKPSAIKKIYLNKKLTKFKPSSLETIFEETSNFCNNDQDCSVLMGGRKIKRALSFSDGFRCNKTLLNKRRAKIKKTFGKRFALKKISLEEFITKLNTSIDKSENDLIHDCQMEGDQSEIVPEIPRSEMLPSNASEKLHDSKNLSDCVALLI